MNAKYVSVTDTAKLVRQELKKGFPGVKFSVRSDSYAGGASIRIRWEDGPTRDEVERVAHMFEGATFDGMIDLKEYHTSIHDGESVNWGADYVFCNRDLSHEKREEIATRVLEYYGCDHVPEFDKYGNLERYTVDHAGDYPRNQLDTITRMVAEHVYPYDGTVSLTA